MAFHKGSKTEEFFHNLVDQLAETLDDVLIYPHKPKWDLEEKLAIEAMIRRKQERQAMYRLQRRDFLRIQRKGKRLRLLLTDAGLIEALRRRVARRGRRLPEGQVCLVSYDIPERHRLARRQVQCLLKDLGFTRLHKSVWCGDKDIANELIRFTRYLRVGDWIQVFIARRVFS